MSDVKRRVERLEEILGTQGCVCEQPEHQLALVVVESHWTSDRIRVADAEAVFECPVHGRRFPPIVHLSPSDMAL
jgi:hypothetical protein